MYRTICLSTNRHKLRRERLDEVLEDGGEAGEHVLQQLRLPVSTCART
jgi:hypothetical protein